MFTNLIADVLSSTERSHGWEAVSTELKMTVKQLKSKVRNNQLSFDEVMTLIRVSESPDLLMGIMELLKKQDVRKWH